MRRKSIRLILVLSVIFLIGLIATQIYWVFKAYELQQKQFNYEVTTALKNVARKILKDSKDPSILIDPVVQISDDYYRVRINDTLYPYYLESLLKNEFKEQEINTSFEYNIYDCFNDSVVFEKYVPFGHDTSFIEQVKAPPVDWDNDAHYFGVYFPEKQKHLLFRMSFWFLSSCLLIIVTIFFAYAMSVILKQKRLSEIKTDFINNMTHEFKTPISTISLCSEVLKKEEIATDKKRLSHYANIIYQENNRLKIQVEKVLQASILDKDNVKLTRSKLDVHDIINNALKSMALSMNELNIRSVLKLNAEHAIITGDEVHITNIILNLLDNACKYSEEGTEIIIKTKNVKDKIRITVQDNGIGIGKDEIKHIFTKFYRVPTGDLHDVKGFGLGLNYVRIMTEAHHGTVSVKSEVGKGSSFQIELPLN